MELEGVGMSDQTMSPDGKWMWTGSEWIPAPPTEESVSENSLANQLSETTVPSERTILTDRNFYYKITGATLLLLSLFFSYLGPESPFSIQFLGADPISKSFDPQSNDYSDSYFVIFTMILSLLIPYAVFVSFIVIAILLLCKVGVKTIGYILTMLSFTLILLIVITFPIANYELTDIGLGLLMLIASGILLTVKGDFQQRM